MVTTIKITCDGVFIQSNSFFTNSHLRSTTTTSLQPRPSTVTSSEHNERQRNALATTTMNGDTNNNRNGIIRFGDDIKCETEDEENGSTPFPVVVVEEQQGNLTIVMRNNRRKIDRDFVENLGLRTAAGGVVNRRSKGSFLEFKDRRDLGPEGPIEEEELYNKVHPKRDQKAVAELRRLAAEEDSDIGTVNGVGGGICRPPYHYMYMVRKVASSRATTTRRDENRSEDAVSGDRGDNYESSRLKGDNAPMSDNVQLNGGVDVDTAANGASRRSSGRSGGDFGPVVDVDAATIDNSEAEHTRLSPQNHNNYSRSGGVQQEENLRHRLSSSSGSSSSSASSIGSDLRKEDHRYSGRGLSVITSADFENWYLRKKVVVDGPRKEEEEEATDQGGLKWTDDVDGAVATTEPLPPIKSPSLSSSSNSGNGSSTTKRARRNSTGQIQIQVALSSSEGAGSDEASRAGGGMNSHTAALNLQSSGQTAVVGHHRGFAPINPVSSTTGGNSASSLDHPSALHGAAVGVRGKASYLHSSGLNNNSIIANNHHHHQQQSASLVGECPWFLQNPGGPTTTTSSSNPMPPTAPLRQHKRPAPQPGSIQYSQQQQPLSLQGHHQVQQHHAHQQLLNAAQLLPTTITELQKPNSIAIQQQQQQTYQSTVNAQHSPKSPNQICGPPPPSLGMSGVGGSSGGVGSSGSLLGHLAAPTGASLMSTSLNSAHLSNHGLQSQAINLSPANSSQSVLHSQAAGSSLLTGLVPNHNSVAMSTSLHGGMGGGGGSSGGGHSPGQNNLNSSSSNSGLSSSTLGGVQQQQQQQNLYIDNGATWPGSGGGGGGNAPLSPTSHGTGSGPPPPLLQRKCEVKLNAMPWFHGSISRDEAEHLLQPREDGLFLVRESTNFPGDYTLCVCFQGKVEHYRVKYLDNKLTIDDEEYFENLGQLVQHYEKDADGLCTQLVKSLPKKGRQDFCINSKDFLDRGWVIPEADLQLRESIGKGEFGDVMLGILRSERVAVKVLKDEGAAQKFLTEASVMTTLEHENLVKFIGLVFTSKHIYLVTEYMSKGSLVDYLRSRGRQHITRKDQINFACDTCSGMEYLEAKKVVHRDLAARNVLISEQCIAKVADFGLAREECYNLDVGKLPIKWTAPEALKGGRFSNKSDMWSFGILLWEIYSFGRVPYPRIPLADVVKHVEVGYKMEAPEGCPSEIYEMMRQAWDLNPARRPTFSELKVKLMQLKSITT